MITIFGTPRAFRGHFGLIQRNAISSWVRLRPRPQVLLMGNEEGTAQACEEFGLTHVPEIECNEYGTPLLSSMIARAEQLARFDLMLLVCTDIILFNDTIHAARMVAQRFRRFCAVAARRDADLHKPIDFVSPSWEIDLHRSIDTGMPKKVAFGDYFLFPKGFWETIPAFAIGRCALDNWLFYRALALGGALVDLSPAVSIVHQNHDYSHHPQGKQGVYKGEEARRNLRLAGGSERLFLISDANWTFTGKLFRRPPWTRQRLHRYLETVLVLKPHFSLLCRWGKILLFPTISSCLAELGRVTNILFSPRRLVETLARKVRLARSALRPSATRG